jgi:geranylgeranyl diphosphate synthase type II
LTNSANVLRSPFEEYLDECRTLVREELQRMVSCGFLGRKARGGATPALYRLMLDYPMRSAKALRPALCIATCRALGGSLAQALPSAAVLELFHNAFLVHDDIEDDSLLRRGKPALHREHGVPIAINVGDAMLALSLQPLLENTRLVGLGKALRILEVVARMCRESVEGQAMELDWIRNRAWDVSDRDYLLMVHKKTSWYTFIAPVRIGAILAAAPPRSRALLDRLAVFLGAAFQIQDDILNLEAAQAELGKEIGGDLEEGKRTLILLHTLRGARPADRKRARALLARERADKSRKELAWLSSLIRESGGIDSARAVAAHYAALAGRVHARLARELPASPHFDLISRLIEFVLQRQH